MDLAAASIPLASSPPNGRRRASSAPEDTGRELVEGVEGGTHERRTLFAASGRPNRTRQARRPTMNQSPSEWELPALLDYLRKGEVEVGIKIAGLTQYAPARPSKNLDTLPERIRLAWSVFTGRADVLFWPGQS